MSRTVSFVQVPTNSLMDTNLSRRTFSLKKHRAHFENPVVIARFFEVFAAQNEMSRDKLS
jgi:hypothetical protein